MSPQFVACWSKIVPRYFKNKTWHLNQKVEIPLLYEHYLQTYNAELYEIIRPFFKDVFAQVFRYPHRGNTRELVSIAERFSVLVDMSFASDPKYIADVLAECIPEDVSSAHSCDSGFIRITGNYHDDIKNAEKSILERYIENCSGTLSDLSRQLGISRATLYNKLKG